MYLSNLHQIVAGVSAAFIEAYDLSCLTGLVNIKSDSLSLEDFCHSLLASADIVTSNYECTGRIQLPKLESGRQLLSMQNSAKINEKVGTILGLLGMVLEQVDQLRLHKYLQCSSSWIAQTSEWYLIPTNYVTAINFWLSKLEPKLLLDKLKSSRSHLKLEILRVVNVSSELSHMGDLCDHVLETLIQTCIPEYCENALLDHVKFDANVFNINRWKLMSLLTYIDTLFTCDGSDLKEQLIIHFKHMLPHLRPLQYGRQLDEARRHMLGKITTSLLSIRIIGLTSMFRMLAELFVYSITNPDGHLLPCSEHKGNCGDRVAAWNSRAFCAVGLGYLPTLEYLLKTSKVNTLTCTDVDGRNLLITATVYEKVDIVNYLLTQVNPPINVNARAVSGNTALHMAVSKNNLEIAKLLLETGGASVDVSNENSNSATPLHVAATFGYTEMIDLLVDHGASISERTSSDHFTAEQLANNGCHVDLGCRLQQFARQTRPKANNLNLLALKNEVISDMRKQFLIKNGSNSAGDRVEKTLHRDSS